MAKKERPLSCDVWNRPWPPKHMTGSPLPPVKSYPPPDPAPYEPILPPNRENWLAAVLGGSAAVLLAVGAVGSGFPLVALPILAYVGLLTWTAWRVRMRPGRGLVFFWWFLPILLQLSLYLLMAWEVASEIVEGPRWNPWLASLAMTCFVTIWVAWIPTIGLLLHARRGGELMLAQTVIPFLATVVTGLFAFGHD